MQRKSEKEIKHTPIHTSHNFCEPIKQLTLCTFTLKAFPTVKDKLHTTEREPVFDVGAERNVCTIRR